MKKCDVVNCFYPVFGTDKNTKKKYCKKHQFLRTDIIKNIKKKTVDQRNDALIKTITNFDPFQWGFKDELSLFNYIWDNRNHISEISGKPLYGGNLYLALFLHVLPKGKYPLYRYNPNNIILAKPIEHVLIDQGSSSARRKYTLENPSADFSIFYNKKIELEQEYKLILKEKMT
jgi:hypothetical protein